MSDRTFRVDYSDLNGVEIKSIRHPNGADTWNEVDACSDIRNAGHPNTAVNLTFHEIDWWKKYADQDFKVVDVYIGFTISVNDYITELENNC
tara:strand:+ start:2541 stop:2816 length:276 start_codon:yes stop_codon:yes gene_type:complete